MVGRITQSDELVSRLGSWCNLPFGINDGLSMIAEDLPIILDLNHPIDIAASLAPEVAAEEAMEPYIAGPNWQDGGVEQERREPQPAYLVATLAVAKPEALVTALEGAGKSVVVREDGSVAIELEHDLHCVLTASAGPTTHRLACGPHPDDLEALAGYANTALVTETMPNKAAYMELRAAPFRERLGGEIREMRAAVPALLKELTIGNERFDRALAEAAPAIVEEIVALADGIDTWNFSLAFMKDRDVLVGESAVRFRKTGSYVADVLTRGATEAAPAPGLFWELPRDVDAASFNGTITATTADKEITDKLTELLAGALEHNGVAAGTLDNWVTSLRELMESRGTVVMGAGSLPIAESAQSTTPASKTPQPKSGKPIRAESKSAVADVLDALGYYLVGVEGDGGAYARIWRSSVATFNDKRLRAELTQTFDDLPKLPLIRTRKVGAKGQPSIEIFELSYKLPKAAKEQLYKLDKFGVYVAMATVGNRTWLGFGFTEAAALQPVKLMISGRDYPKLGSRAGLTRLHEQPVLHGSFSSVNSYAKLFAGLPFGPGSAPFGESLMRAMPHDGTTPTVFELRTSADGPALTVRAELPREVFEDGSALTMALVAAFTSALKGGNGFGFD